MKHSSLEADSHSASQEISRPLWDPYSQEPATGSYSEPDDSNPHLRILFL